MFDWMVLMGLAVAVDVRAVSNCAGLADDRARLACYDALFPPSAAMAAPRAMPVPAPASAPPAAAAAATSGVAGAAAGVAAAAPQVPAARSTPEPAAPAAATGPAAPAPAVIPAAIPPASPTETFGLSAEQQQRRTPEKPAELEAIESQVTAVKALQYDRFRLTLENGQVWSQTEPTPRQQFYPGDTIKIRKAALGSYLATGPKSSGGVRVRREQ